MSVKRVRLVGQVSESIINNHIFDPEAYANRWLINPHFFLVKCVAIRQCLLKIGNAGPKKQYVLVGGFQADMGINIDSSVADKCIALSVESKIEICLGLQIKFFSN